jgi:hypothetical protein
MPNKPDIRVPKFFAAFLLHVNLKAKILTIIAKKGMPKKSFLKLFGLRLNCKNTATRKPKIRTRADLSMKIL